jgi:hypothetical protein
MPTPKQVYICGDSFGAVDPAYGPSWVAQLQDLLLTNAQIVNLSRVCASNLHISLQVDCAIKNSADFIIYLATSSVREDGRLGSNRIHTELLDRFADITKSNPTADLTSYSLMSLNETTLFNNAQLAVLKQHAADFFDLDLAIARNELIIEGTLSRLTNSAIPYVFDQGGFEHPNYAQTDRNYFPAYQQYRSGICVWDYIDTRQHRPYYHIKDPQIHSTIANYYLNLINDKT